MNNKDRRKRKNSPTKKIPSHTEPRTWSSPRRSQNWISDAQNGEADALTTRSPCMQPALGVINLSYAVNTHLAYVERQSGIAQCPPFMHIYGHICSTWTSEQTRAGCFLLKHLPESSSVRMWLCVNAYLSRIYGWCGYLYFYGCINGGRGVDAAEHFRALGVFCKVISLVAGMRWRGARLRDGVSGWFGFAFQFPQGMTAKANAGNHLLEKKIKIIKRSSESCQRVTLLHFLFAFIRTVCSFIW